MAKRVWARDMWHLGNRLLRKVLSHTIAFMLNQAQGNPPSANIQAGQLNLNLRIGLI